VENYVLSPRISAKTMQLHPAVAFGSAIAGASILGPIGAFLALPAAAIIQAFGSAYIHRHDVVDSEYVRDDEPPDAQARAGARKQRREAARDRRASTWQRILHKADDEDSPA
jgi:hypothetical protein